MDILAEPNIWPATVPVAGWQAMRGGVVPELGQAPGPDPTGQDGPFATQAASFRSRASATTFSDTLTGQIA